VASEWKFDVTGTPRPKGSWTAVPRKGALHLFQSGERYYRAKDMVLIPASDKLLARWVTAIQWAAKGADPPPRPIEGPWYCGITFWFLPPTSRIGQTWALGDKREDLHSPRTGPTGDEDKLRRAVLDALTGIFWENDRHVVDGAQTKLYCQRRKPGATIVCRYLESEQLCLK
jgi:Holliday junction resolvase RusA-like endonuclease